MRINPKDNLYLFGMLLLSLSQRSVLLLFVLLNRIAQCFTGKRQNNSLVGLSQIENQCLIKSTTAILTKSTNIFDGEGSKNRRHLLTSGLFSTSWGLLNYPGASYADETSTVSSGTLRPEQASITDKVVFNVRVSRQDGTFYTRDDLPDIPENKVFYGTITVGLFGNDAPRHVERFLSYITTSTLDENPMPSYGRSFFPSFDQRTGVLTGGKIPALEYTEISGRSALRYGERLLPATLWVETATPSSKRISHTEKGLLTHRFLEVLPTFGITTRSDTTELDKSNQVFGRILFDESSREFLALVQDLPTYSIERPSSMNDPTKDDVVQDAAKIVFDAQRSFFRGAAKSLGDGRVGKVYEGKILRRVEVTQVRLL